MKRILALLAGMLTAVAFGQTSAEKIAAGRAALVAHDLPTAQMRFQEARLLAPSDQTAAALLGITQVFAVSGQGATNAFLDGAGVASTGRNIYQWTADPARDASGGVVLPSNYNLTTAASYWQTTLLPTLVAARGNLAAVTSTNFSLVLQPEETSLPNAVTIDYGDVLMMRACLSAAEFSFNFLSGQNLDLNLANAVALANGDLLTFQRLLRDNPNFLALGDTSRRSAAKAAFLELASVYRQASEFIRGRPSGVDRMFMLDPTDLTAEAEFRDNLTLGERSLTRPISPEPGRGSVFTGPMFGSTWAMRDRVPALTADGFDFESITDTSLGGVAAGLTREDIAGFFSPPELGWQMVNPLPTGVALTRSLLLANGKRVVVGQGGIVFTSTDSVTWTSNYGAIAGAGRVLGLAEGSGPNAGKLVAVGALGRIFLSQDAGATWLSVGSDFGTFRSVAYGGGRFVAVSNDGVCATSTDGMHWQFGTLGTFSLLDVAYIPSRSCFLGSGSVSSSAVVAESTDGLTWTTRYSVAGGAFVQLAQNGLNLVTVGSSGHKGLSTDAGLTWTDGTLISGNTTSLTSLAFRSSDATFIAAGNSGIVAVSTDNGATWTQVAVTTTQAPSGETGTINSVTVAPDGVLFAMAGGVVLRSANLTAGASTFTRVVTPTSPVSVGTTFNSIRLLGSTLYAVGANDSIVSSTDGTTFAAATTGTSGIAYWSIMSQGGALYAVGTAGTMIKSTNGGTTWTPVTTGVANTITLRFVGYVNGLYLTTGSTGMIYSSPDGTTWTQRSSTPSNTGLSVYGVVYGNGKYVAVGGNDATGTNLSRQYRATSTDGLTWTTSVTDNQPTLRGVAFYQGVFTAVGYNGTMLRSADGVTWTGVSTPASTDFFDIRVLNGRYYALQRTRGDFATEIQSAVLVSVDGLSWARIELKNDLTPMSVELFNNRLHIAGAAAMILRSEAIAAPALPVTQPTVTTLQAVQGESVALGVASSRPSGETYQWFKNGSSTPISGAIGPVLDFASVLASDAGSYVMKATNATGTTAASAITLGVSVPLPRQLINLSTRVAIQTSADLTASFTVEGTGTKRVLIRLIGPALSTFGISTYLQDPMVTLCNASGVPIISNNDWGTAASSPALTAAFSQIGAFPLTDNSKDAALIATLSPGMYTVRVGSNVPGGIGSVLAEVYDLDTGTVVNSRFAYLAARTNAGGTYGTATVGFALGGTGSRTYLVRALGPALNLGNQLSDPSLTLFSGSTSLATNDNWGTAGTQPALVNAQVAAGATPLVDSSKDAALLPSLAPGSYTGQISGVGGTSGLMLFEVHDIDPLRLTHAPGFPSTPPSAVLATTGSPYSLGHAFVGLPAPSFAWTKNGTTIAGQTSPTLTFGSVSAGDVATYRLTATNSAGATSADYQFEIPAGPSISTQPTNQTTTLGGSATFTVSATGAPAPTYQWRRNGVAIPGATNGFLTITNAQFADVGTYSVVVTNASGSVTSGNATLAGANAAPTINTPPQSVVVTAGATANFTVTASGTGSLQYQWRRNGFPISGATNTALSLPSVGRSEADYYDVVVNDGLSYTVSAPARLSVAPTVYPGLVRTDSAWSIMAENLGGTGNAILPIPAGAAVAPGGAYVGGTFTTVNGVAQTMVMRLLATGEVDPTFSPPALESTVSALALQADGKLVIGGSFTRVAGALGRSYLVRLTTTGALDPTFNVGLNGTVNAIVTQADGKLILGGSFTTVNGFSLARLARLAPDGTIDPSFAIGSGFNNTINALALDASGRVLVGGAFTSVNGVSGINRLVRVLTADGIAGMLDPSFDAGTGADNTVSALAVQSDGKILLGGSFATVNGVSAPRLARVLASGALDQGAGSFTTNLGGAINSGAVQAILVQSDGAILLGGSFGANGNIHANFTRVGANGTPDSFAPPAPSGALTALAFAADGKVLLGGGFNNVGGGSTPRYVVARLNADLSTDPSCFVVTRTTNNLVTAVWPLPSGKVLVAGAFQFIRGLPVPLNLSRFNADGTLDPTFNFSGAVRAIQVTNPGRGYTSAPTVVFSGGGGSGAAATATVVGGMVTTISITNTGSGYTSAPTISFSGGGATVPAAALVNIGNTGANNLINALAVLPDGRIAVAGSFTTFNGTPRNRVALLSADGAVDATLVTGGSLTSLTISNGGSGYTSAPTVSLTGGGGAGAAATAVISGGVVTGLTLTNAGTGYTSAPTVSFSGGGGSGAAATAALVAGVNGQVLTLAPLPPLVPGGLPRLFLGGAFTAVNGATLTRVAILNLDGSLDPTFTASGAGADGNVLVSAVQPDGKIILGGQFANYAGTARADIARITPTGALDTTFLPSGTTGFNGQVAGLAIVPPPSANAGKIYASGSFGTFNGTTVNSVARLTSTGTLDTAFAPAAGSGGVFGMLLQEDGAVLARGSFIASVYGGTGAVRLGSSAGSRDTTFAAAGLSGVATSSAALVMANDGRLFTTNNGVGLASLVPGSGPSIDTAPATQTVAVGAPATFSVGASGTGPLTYQWLFNGVTIPGATNSSYTVAAAQLTDVGAYAVTVANELGAVTSSTAMLTGTGAVPTITTQPAGQTVTGGPSTNVTLTVAAAGATHYQWLRNGNAIAGATSASFTINGARPVDSDSYAVIVGNGLSSTISNAASLIVTPPVLPNGLKADVTYNLALETNVVSTGIARAVVADGSGGFYVAGDFSRFGGAGGGVRSRVARFTAAGTLDPTFVPPSFDGNVRALVLDTNGTLLVGGSFYYVNGFQHARLVRLNATTGALDSSFDAFVGTDGSGQVNALALQSDGKILVGGTFSSVSGGTATGANGVLRPALARLNADGTPDLAYDPKLTVSSGTLTVSALVVLSGDKLAVGGTFNTVGGATMNNFVVLNSSGAVDAAFTAAGTGPNLAVSSIAKNASGQLLLGGLFTAYNTTSGVNRIALVEQTGALATGFSSGAGVNNTVSAILPLSGGGFLISGTFTTYNNTARFGFAKISATGALDPAFNPGPAYNGLGANGSVVGMAVDSNGKLVVGGDFNTIAGVPRARIARLMDTTAGQIDPTLDPDTLAPASAFAIAEQPGSGGKFLVLTNATRLGGNAIPTGLIRLNANGSFDASYNSGGAGMTISSAAGSYRLAVTGDGKAYISGNFVAYNGGRRNFLARINADGTLDASFSPGTGPVNSNVFALTPLPSGQVLVAGSFATFNGVTRNGLVRLNADGSVDAALQAPPSSITINALAPAGAASNPTVPGKFYIGGSFSGSFSGIWGGATVNRVARLNSDGTLDAAFNAGTGPNNTVNALAVQPDGKVLVGGSFTAVSGASRTGYARLNTDGSFDSTFGSVFSSANAVTGFTLPGDGSVFVRGTFSFVNVAVPVVSGAETATVTTSRNLARLNSAGIPDAGFGLYGFDGFSANDFAVLADGSVLVGTQNLNVAFDGTSWPALTKLVAQTGLAIAQQPNDRRVYAGASTGFSAETRNGVSTPRFQWRKGGLPLTPSPRYQGIYSRGFNVVDAQAADAGSYDCVITDGTTTVTSRPATLTVLATAPSVALPEVMTRLDGLIFETSLLSTTTAPTYTYTEGTPVMLTATATGTEPLSYQWQRNGVDVSGATDSRLRLGLLTSANAGAYTLRVTNAVGTGTSSAATLVVANSTPTAPVILRAPGQLAVTPGASGFFTVLAAGTGPLSYQWQWKAAGGSTFSDVTGATQRDLVLPAVSAADAGVYRVVVSNATGSVTSGEAALTLGNTSVWSWRHPLPTGDSLRNVAYGAGRYVALAHSGTIVTSPDGVSWTVARTFSGIPFEDLTFGGGKFVAVAATGVVATSADGLSWSFGNINPPNATPAYGAFVVFHDGTRFVLTAGVPGAPVTIFTSTDGVSWTNRGAPAAVNPAQPGFFGGIAPMAYGAGTYLGFDPAGDPYLYTSTDLVTWTPRPIPVRPGAYVNHAIFTGGTFYAVGDTDALLRSTDNGATWTYGDADIGSTQNWQSVAALGGTLVAANTNGSFATSTDGMKWSLAQTGPVGLGGDSVPERIATLNNQFVMVGDGGMLATSTDGRTWTERFTRPVGLANFNAVTYAAAGFVAVGNLGQVGFSTDGTTWISGDTQTRTNLLGVTSGTVSGGFRYVAVGGSGFTSISSDGTLWKNTVIGGQGLNAVAFTGTQFVAVGNAGRISTSTDGIVWTDRTSGTSAVLRSVTANGAVVVAGGDGVILRSTDSGATWTAATSGLTSTDSVRSILYQGGKFMTIVGGNPAISDLLLTSVDGSTWSSAPLPFSQSVRGLVYAGGRYVGIGGSGGVVTSADGTTWTADTSNSFDGFSGLAAGPQGLIAVGASGAIVRAPLAPPPAITAIAPTNLTGSAPVSLYGSGFTGATSVTFNGVAATNFTVVSDVQIDATTPSNLTLGPIQVVAPGGTSLPRTDFTTFTLPVFTTQPLSQTIVVGQPATLTATATGSPTPTFQWRKQPSGGSGFTNIAGATNSTLSFTPVTLADAGTYVVVATNSGGSVTSSSAVLTVNGSAPAITTQPAAASIYVVGASLTLNVAASGVPAPTYQWRKGGSAITGATGASLAFASLTVADAGTYDVVVTNPVSSVTSNAVTFVVHQPPTITTPPQSQTIVAGQNATFSVVVGGVPAPSYQWRRNGLNLAGATNASLTLTAVPFDGGGNITVVVSNAAGTITSPVALLTVNPVAPVITSAGTASGVLGHTFVYLTTASTTQATFGATGLPAGLTINPSSGVISGVPTVTGTFSVGLSATNVSGSDTKTLTLTITPPAPIINSAPAATGRLGTAFTFTVAAVNTPTSFGATGLPAGLSINATTGVISGTPTVSGTFAVTLSATNSGGVTTSPFLLTIQPPLNAPTFSGSRQLTAVQNTGFSYSPNFVTSGLTTTYTASLVPPGLAFDGATGTLSGTPTATGVYSIAVTATNSGGALTVTFTLTVNPPPSAPTITSASLASATVGTAFSFTLTGSGSPTSFNATGLPALGLSLTSSSGVIAGTPTAPGTLTLQVSATNAVGTGPQAALVITINPAAGAPIISSGSVAQGRVGDPFSLTLSATNSPTGFTVTSGALPAGLTLNVTSGAITGTPTQVGQFTVWIAASNASGPGFALQLLFNIAPAPTTPVVTSNGTAAGQVGQSFQYLITATNAPTSFAASGLPSGLTLNTATGVISGTPADATTTPISFTVTATNGDGTSVPKTVLLSVAAAPATPVITSPLIAGGRVGLAFNYQIRASDNATSYVAQNLPAGLTLNADTGVISGAPTVSGSFEVALRAANAAGLGAASTLRLAFGPPLTAPAITSAPSAPGKVGVVFTYVITTNSPATGFAVTGSLPLGLALNTSTGILSGTPAASGIFTVQLTAVGVGGTSLPQTFVLNIAPADNVPVITSAIYASATVGQSFTYQITAASSPAFPSAPFPAPFTLDAVNLPAGLAVNPSTGVIQGQPTTAGVFTATLVGTNSAGTGPFRTLTFFIQPAPAAPVVTSSTFAAAQVGAAFSYQITATNSPTSFDVLGAPAWMTVNTATGALAGVPTRPGAASVQLVASNAAGSSNPQTLLLTIAPSASAPVVTSTRTAAGTVSQAFTYQITAAVPSGAPPVSSYVATGLPSGLTLDASTGMISGTPTASGQYEVSVIARNSAGDSQPVAVIVTIRPSLTFNGGS